MKARDRGTIVQVGSALAYRGIPLQTRVLRGEARHPGIPRVAALRTAAREEQRARDDGADAGGEHPAVLVGALQAAAASAAGAADLPAGDVAAQRPVRRRPPPPPRVLGGLDHHGHAGGQRRSARACSTGTWADRLRLPADRPSPMTRTPPTTFLPRRRRTRPRLRCPRRVRRQVPHLGSAAVGLPEPRGVGGRCAAAVAGLIGWRRGKG